MRVVLATRNRHKLEELRRILAPYDVELLSLDDYPDVADVDETGATFADNALVKAQSVATATGLVAARTLPRIRPAMRPMTTRRTRTLPRPRRQTRLSRTWLSQPVRLLIAPLRRSARAATESSDMARGQSASTRRR